MNKKFWTVISCIVALFLFSINKNVFSQIISDSLCCKQLVIVRDSVFQLGLLNFKNEKIITEYKTTIHLLRDSLGKANQELRGYIEDQKGNPVRGIRVQFRTHPMIYTKTDAHGFFRLNLPDTFTDKEPVCLMIKQRGWTPMDTSQLRVKLKKHPVAQYVIQDRIQIQLQHKPIRVVALILENELGTLKDHSYVQNQLMQYLLDNQFEVHDLRTIWSADKIRNLSASFKKGDYRAIIDETKSKYDYLLVGIVETIESKAGTANPYGQSSQIVSSWGSVSVRIINLQDQRIISSFSKEAIKGLAKGDIQKASATALKNIASECQSLVDEFCYDGE